jgi:hypothetical protein
MVSWKTHNRNRSHFCGVYLTSMVLDRRPQKLNNFYEPTEGVLTSVLHKKQLMEVAFISVRSKACDKSSLISVRWPRRPWKFLKLSHVAARAASQP